MSGLRHSAHRVGLVVLVDLKRGTHLPAGVGPALPTLRIALNVLREADTVSVFVDERAHQGAA